MADIRISYADLRGAVSNLDYVAGQFKDSDSSSETAAAATGHDGLAKRVREFADNWDGNRRNFQEAAESMSAAVDDMMTAFQDLDMKLAADE